MDNTPAEQNPKKLFVGNLPYSTTEEDLTNLFAEYGDLVEVKLIVDRMSGRSRGIAFVTYETEEAAQAAIEALHETELDGRNMIVNVARPPRPREDRHSGGYRGGRRDDRRNDRRSA